MRSMLLERLASIGTALAVLLAIPTVASAQEFAQAFENEEWGPEWTVRATDPYLIGGYGDNFDYDGDRVTELRSGIAYMHVNAETNQGWILARFEGTVHPAKGKEYSGQFTLFFPMFMSEGPAYWEGGVADYVVLHGNTGREAPIMPRIPSYLTTWGPAMVMVDGQRIHAGPGHTMLTERSRDPETGAIYADYEHTENYSPMRPAKGVMYKPGEKELHFVVRSDERDDGNFPKFDFFLHLNYANVEVGAEIPEELARRAKQMQQRAKEMMQRQSMK